MLLFKIIAIQFGAWLLLAGALCWIARTLTSLGGFSTMEILVSLGFTAVLFQQHLRSFR